MAHLPLLFNPGVDVCVDEQLVAFKGRCGFRQYMPNKPAKYGINTIQIWVTCDVATSYAWWMQIYTGGLRMSAQQKQWTQGESPPNRPMCTAGPCSHPDFSSEGNQGDQRDFSLQNQSWHTLQSVLFLAGRIE